MICIRPHFPVKKIVVDFGGSSFLNFFLSSFLKFKAQYEWIWNKLNVYMLLGFKCKMKKTALQGKWFYSLLEAVRRGCRLYGGWSVLFCFVTLANHSNSLCLGFSYSSNSGGQEPYDGVSIQRNVLSHPYPPTMFCIEFQGTARALETHLQML